MTPVGSSAVTVSVDSGVARVRLNRPDKLNALTLDTLDALVAAAHGLTRDRTLRGVVLGGEGRSFCAGLDFGTVLKDPRRIARAFVPRPWRGTNTFQEACWAWRRIPVPVVAAVRGHCFGGGLQLALGADVRITTADAQWAVLEAQWGLVPDMSGIHALSQQIGMDVAKRLTMTGEVISGERAVALGLATEVADDPDAAAAELIATIAARSPDSVAAAKRLFDRTWTARARRTFARERFAQARLLASANAKIAREAAMAKAAPRYRPRSR
jgi:enoyl-CoA hydratase/carnithine racemase